MSLLSDFEELEITPSFWHAQLDAATSEDEIVRVMQDYLAQLSTRELASLPPRCRPTRLKAADDLGFWTLALAQHQCKSSIESVDVVQAILNHFLHASLRLSEVPRRRSSSAAVPLCPSCYRAAPG